jgi:hypothetical protein
MIARICFIRTAVTFDICGLVALFVHFMNLLTMALLLFFAQEPRSASVQGTVLQTGTSQGLARATVELRGESERNSFTTTTFSDGKFEFRNLAADMS